MAKTFRHYDELPKKYAAIIDDDNLVSDFWGRKTYRMAVGDNTIIVNVSSWQGEARHSVEMVSNADIKAHTMWFNDEGDICREGEGEEYVNWDAIITTPICCTYIVR